MVYLKNGCPIPPTRAMEITPWQDTEKWDERYVAINELNRAAGYEVVGVDDLYIVENIDPEEKDVKI